MIEKTKTLTVDLTFVRDFSDDVDMHNNDWTKKEWEEFFKRVIYADDAKVKNLKVFSMHKEDSNERDLK